MKSRAATWYHRFVTHDAAAEAQVGGTDQVARNGLRLIASGALQSAGDQVVNAKTVLPWILDGVGAPPALIALLVPIRESGSMLPQAAMTPRVVAARRRSSVWVAGAIGQAVAVAGMAGAAAVLEGTTAGLAIVALLAVFALARALCSMASKDVMGRTLPKGQRGQISGLSTVVSGLVAVGVGLGLRAFGDGLSPQVLALFLAGAALAWFLGALVYRGMEEPAPEERIDGEAATSWWRDSLDLFRTDRHFRNFVTVRALLLVSALSPPFFVTLAAGYGNTMISGLGGFVIASALASILGGWTSGRLADRSSRNLMVAGAAAASAVVAAVVAVVLLAGDREIGWVFTVGFFLVSLVHVGVRVARKTYVVDMAEGDTRTRYVAVANTAMGVILLVTGAISAFIASFGEVPALVFLAVLGLAGAVLGARLPDVSQK